MRFKLLLATLLAWAGVTCLISLAAEPGKARPLKFQIQLLWGTNDPQSPDPKHKPVDEEVAKKQEQTSAQTQREMCFAQAENGNGDVHNRG